MKQAPDCIETRSEHEKEGIMAPAAQDAWCPVARKPHAKSPKPTSSKAPKVASPKQSSPKAPKVTSPKPTSPKAPKVASPKQTSPKAPAVALHEQTKPKTKTPEKQNQAKQNAKNNSAIGGEQQSAKAGQFNQGKGFLKQRAKVTKSVEQETADADTKIAARSKSAVQTV